MTNGRIEILVQMLFCPRHLNIIISHCQSLNFELAVLNHYFITTRFPQTAVLQFEFKSLRHHYYSDNKQFCTFSKFSKTQNSSSAIGRGSAHPIVAPAPFVGSVSCSQTKLSCHSGQYWAPGCFNNLGKKNKTTKKLESLTFSA